MVPKSAILFRLCWLGCLGGLTAGIPILAFLYLGVLHPRYGWTSHFWEVLVIGTAILCIIALRADMKARHKA